MFTPMMHLFWKLTFKLDIVATVKNQLTENVKQNDIESPPDFIYSS